MNNLDTSTNPAKRAALVHELDETIADVQSAKTFEEGLHVLALQSRLLIGTHQSAISYVPDGSFPEGIHTHSFSDKYAKYNSYDVMPTGKGIWGVIVKNRVPVRMTQKELLSHCKWKNFSDLKDARGLEHPPMKGWLAAPILCKNGDFLGVFQLSDKIDGEFTDYDLELFSRLAKLAAPMFELQYVNMELKQEIEERKQAETALTETQAQLVQSAKLASIGQIAAGLAHEINQPLGVIRGRVDLTQLILECDQDVDKDSVTANLNDISAEIVRASKIIKHLKVFSRQDKLSEYVATDINWLINESFVLMNKTLQLEGIDVQKEFAQDLPPVLCDYVQIEQVFTNLIANAIDALQESDEKQLVIRSYQRGNYIYIEVNDAGLGMPKTIMEKVFDPFFTTKPVGQGTGLGLSISHGIIQEHSGTLAVTSEEGEGTCFTISLPITA